MARFAFIGAAYRVRATSFAAEQCINLYPEIGNATAKNVLCLLGTPGKLLWKNFAGGAVRGMLRFSAELAIVVSNSNIYKVTNAGVSTLIGVCAAGTTPVSMASNGSVVMLVTGAQGYFINPTAGTVTPILDPDFHGADFVAYLDGYFVFNWLNTGKFQITKLLDTAIDGLDFASAEGSPDIILSLLVSHRELWIFGEVSTEVYWNSGNRDFPLERINGAYLEWGTAAKYSPAKLGGQIFWLSFNEDGQGIVVRSKAYQPERVSDHGVEYAISQMSTISDAVGWTYQQEGHEFYVLTFPTAQQTWAYDATTGMWHQRAYRVPGTAAVERDRVMCQMAFAGKQLVGDHTNGNVYELKLDHYTDNGDIISRVRAALYPPDADYRWQSHDWLQVDMDVGVGLNVADEATGRDPQVQLEWSDNNGISWSNVHRASAGKIGENKRRVRWRRLGRSRNRIYRVTIAEPVKVALTAAAAGVRVGRS